MRAAVIKRDGLTCQLCGVEVIEGGRGPTALNMDHIIQRAIGGPDTLDNLRVACAQCNMRRPRPVTEYVAQSRTYNRIISARRRERRRNTEHVPDPNLERLLTRGSARQRRQGIA